MPRERSPEGQEAIRDFLRWFMTLAPPHDGAQGWEFKYGDYAICEIASGDDGCREWVRARQTPDEWLAAYLADRRP